MRAYQFLTEEKKVTVYTDPSYQGATLDDKYWNSKPSQKIDFDKLEPFEPESKMKAKKSADNMKRFADKIKAGEKIKPLIVTPKDGKYLILDGHHRYFAAKIVGVDSMEANIVPANVVTFTDEVPDESEQHKQEYHKEEAAGVGIVTKQNATKDVPVGGEYMNLKKLKLAKENFADGKKKGKSRPGRVKRAGASCKGSVTSLRSKAKKYGGEKGKMYHWCANMKSGRKK